MYCWFCIAHIHSYVSLKDGKLSKVSCRDILLRWIYAHFFELIIDSTLDVVHIQLLMSNVRLQLVDVARKHQLWEKEVL